MSAGVDHALTTVANAIQARKHAAQITTSRCASEADWDMEAYWRARSEGLAQAEAIVRAHIASRPGAEASEDAHPTKGKES